jgi:hypothetical protein
VVLLDDLARFAVDAVDHRKRFVARAEAGRGWRIWDNQQKRWSGPALTRQPDALLAELNKSTGRSGAPSSFVRPCSPCPQSSA